MAACLENVCRKSSSRPHRDKKLTLTEPDGSRYERTRPGETSRRGGGRSVSEKKAILEEADTCSKPGELGALLRRNGLYSSSLCDWRKARQRGELDGLTPKKRGPVTRVLSAAEKENLQLKRALAKSEARLKR